MPGHHGGTDELWPDLYWFDISRWTGVKPVSSRLLFLWLLRFSRGLYISFLLHKQSHAKFQPTPRCPSHRLLLAVVNCDKDRPHRGSAALAWSSGTALLSRKCMDPFERGIWSRRCQSVRATPCDNIVSGVYADAPASPGPGGFAGNEHSYSLPAWDFSSSQTR